LCCSPFRGKNIPIFPVLGNHEYWGSNTAALNNCAFRFPIIKKQHWYSKKHGNLGMIFLDSNKDDMTENEWRDQYEWFAATVKEYEADPEIKYFCVFTHHPPFTNSTVTGDEIDVQETFVDDFTSSEKGRIFFSGHAHTYERFEIKDKTFIVSGGGGGPRVDLRVGPDCHVDSFKGTAPRPFHYILLDQKNNELNVTVKGLRKGDTQFFVMENLSFRSKNLEGFTAN
jgi:hypothetical protein